MSGDCRMSLLAAFDGPFARWLGDRRPWTAWRVFLKVLAAEPLNGPELELYYRCTGRMSPPTAPVTEAWVVVGRRGRKSSMAALLAVYQSVYRIWPRAAGETLRTLVGRDQQGPGWADPVLRRGDPTVDARAWSGRSSAVNSETITLTNGIEIKCVANSFRSIRGPTVVCAIFEELAFWRDDNSANPDKEILRAVRPSMLTAKGSVLIGISSPYAKRGLLYEKHRDHYGRDDSKVLVWQACD